MINRAIYPIVGWVLHRLDTNIEGIKNGIENEIKEGIQRELNNQISSKGIEVEVTKTDELEYEILVTDTNPTGFTNYHKVSVHWETESPLAPMYRIVNEWSEPK